MGVQSNNGVQGNMGVQINTGVQINMDVQGNTGVQIFRPTTQLWQALF